MVNEILKIDVLEAELFSKIFEIVEIEQVASCQEAQKLIYYLTNHPSPLREACALKLEEICPKFYNYFLDDFSKNKFLDALIDINPNICRAMCSIISNVKQIADLLELDIVLKIKDLLKEIMSCENTCKDFFLISVKNTKSHAKNKKIFALYWLLEALFFSFSGKYNSEVLEILIVTINFNDFTIREKTAQLLKKTANPPLELLKKAKRDQNFYVKIQVYDKINFDD